MKDAAGKEKTAVEFKEIKRGADGNVHAQGG